MTKNKKPALPCWAFHAATLFVRDTRYVQLIDQPQTMMHFIKKIPKKQKQQPEMTKAKKRASEWDLLKWRGITSTSTQFGGQQHGTQFTIGNRRMVIRGIHQMGLSAGQVLTHQPNPVKCTKTYKCLKNIMSGVVAVVGSIIKSDHLSGGPHMNEICAPFQPRYCFAFIEINNLWTCYNLYVIKLIKLKNLFSMIHRNLPLWVCGWML